MLRERAVAVKISPDLVERLANTLLDLARDQDVRVIEALAAVLARQARDDQPEGYPGLSETGSQPRFVIEPSSPEDTLRRAICRRIARRALHGTLVDPTGGATAAHRIDVSPAWAHDLLPIGMFGPFLFYRPPSRAAWRVGRG
ncbi:MAG TPA: hypothetical protein VFV80_08540 [Geminicoccaceae bacterium]|nr:hypothetical protein [Geminicoccaceae bacterium]